jgi:nucleotide-binding universal stress UspA family protein
MSIVCGSDFSEMAAHAATEIKRATHARRQACRQAAEVRADLLVLGSRGRGAFERFWEGSVARQVVHAAAMSVACVPEPAQTADVPRHEAVLATGGG